MDLIIISLAPVLAITLFIYYKDKYEKEPVKVLLWAFGAGVLSVIPIIIIEQMLSKNGGSQYISIYRNAAYDAFVVAAFTEELFKFLAFMIVIWRNKNFNEPFDGIIYATMVSLGFATFENILYVIQGGYSVGIMRAFTAVPLHAVCGVSMGFFIATAKFKPEKSTLYLFLAVIVPIFIHGVYDFIIMSKDKILLLLFVPYVIFIIIVAVKKMKIQSEKSYFKNTPQNDIMSEE